MRHEIGKLGMPTIARVVVSAADLERSLTFYRDLLGLAFQNRGPGSAFLRTSDGIEIMVHERPVVPSDSAVAIAFEIDHLDSVVDQWARARGVIVDPPEKQPWGEVMAVVKDPDGHVVCLSQRATNSGPAEVHPDDARTVSPHW